jgi:DNA-binding response OmpR family regulator
MRSPSARPTILLVEDSEDDAFFFRWSLRKAGIPCELTVAADGGEAIQQLEDARAHGTCPDLVFLDLKIPTFSGFQVLAWIREQRFDPPLDVAVLSGSEHASDIQRATALGASGYFVKPLSVDQLRARLTAWLQKQEGPRHESAEAHAASSTNGPA